jgi:hypothetical protein
MNTEHQKDLLPVYNTNNISTVQHQNGSLAVNAMREYHHVDCLRKKHVITAETIDFKS